MSWALTKVASPAAGYYPDVVKLRFDSLGQPHVLWSAVAYPPEGNTYQIHHSCLQAGVWTDTLLCTISPSVPDHVLTDPPCFDMNGDTIHAAYATTYNYLEAHSDLVVYHASCGLADSELTFSEAHRVTNHTVWAYNCFGLDYRGGPQPPYSICDEPGGSLALIVDASGVEHILFAAAANGASYVYYYVTQDPPDNHWVWHETTAQYESWLFVISDGSVATLEHHFEIEASQYDLTKETWGVPVEDYLLIASGSLYFAAWHGYDTPADDTATDEYWIYDLAGSQVELLAQLGPYSRSGDDSPWWGGIGAIGNDVDGSYAAAHDPPVLAESEPPEDPTLVSDTFTGSLPPVPFAYDAMISLYVVGGLLAYSATDYDAVPVTPYYCYYEDDAWHREVIASIYAYAPSLAADPEDRPAVAFSSFDEAAWTFDIYYALRVRTFSTWSGLW